MKQVPVVVDVIGALVARPEGSGADFDRVAQLVAQESPARKWYLLDASVLVAQTLRDVCTQVSGSTGGVTYTDTEVLSGAGVSEAMTAGARDAVSMVLAPTGLYPAGVAERYRTEPGSDEITEADERLLGVVVMSCLCSAALVRAIAGATQTPVRRAWKKIAPLLLEP